MTSLASLATDWAGYLPAQKVFYGIGCLAAFLIVILGVLQLIGMEAHTDIEHPDHDGASLFSTKPIIGFFFGFGWVGGYSLGQTSFLPSATFALLAGACFMFTIWGIIRVFVKFQNDGSMILASAVGKDGIVYATIDPAKGGQIQVILNTGLETLPAVTRETQPISTGKTVTVIRIDGPNLLVESKQK